FKHRHTGAGRYPLFHVFLFLYSQTGSPRLRHAMTRVCQGQVQEVARTQWIPAVAGMTTFFKFYLFKYRHTGAGRYPMFHVFLFTGRRRRGDDDGGFHHLH
ncbi:MAG: hypothetical protein J6L47_00805, partial [Alphaproteobacteria bacterium]|nr:hypothetical protein [Alphaproteobacteria bacterium]